MTVSHPDPRLEELANLLREAGASPRISPERIVRSTLYDLEYHVGVIACAFVSLAEERLDHSKVVVAHWLKLLQFVAVRPALLPAFMRWAKARRRPDLDSWQRMPRGYLGDRTHDRTVEYLVASNVLVRETDKLASGVRFGVLTAMYQQIAQKEMFKSERDTLHQLSALPVNLTLIRGR